MRSSEVITRLRSSCPALKKVGGSADLDAAIQSAPALLPAAFVMPAGHQAQPSTTTGSFEQADQQRVAVVLVLNNRRDSTGAAAVDDLEDLLQALRGALVGWVPDAETGEPVHSVNGRLLRFGDGQLWWGEEFALNATLGDEQ